MKTIITLIILFYAMSILAFTGHNDTAFDFGNRSLSWAPASEMNSLSSLMDCTKDSTCATNDGIGNGIIPYQLSKPQTITISVYNTKGHMVLLYQKTHSKAGTFSLRLNGRTAHGKALTKGVYSCVMSTGSSVSNTKLILIK